MREWLALPLAGAADILTALFTHEWVIVTLAGALGGLTATMFSQRPLTDGGVANPKHPAWSRCWQRIWVSFLNMFGGAIASFILWATYTSSVNFDSTNYSPSEVAAALTVGLGGVGAVRGFMHEAGRADKWETAAKASTVAAADLEDDLNASMVSPITSPPTVPVPSPPIDTPATSAHNVNKGGQNHAAGEGDNPRTIG